ncbi:MAG: S41 family peptidase [Candidatus Zambryskibacteria bacterium]|nr:S41 family peptidase [Candidatus Zambryskibacteria bacterium]
MNKERYTQIIWSIVIAGILFSLGYYTGKGDSWQNPPQILNATSTESADMGSFWRAWQLLDEKFAPSSSTTPQISNKEKIWGAIQGLAASYGDPYTVFFPPEESKAFEEDISGSFGGVGMEIEVRDGLLTVVAPLKDTPAEKAGVKAGDKIIAIGDTPSISMSSTEAVKMIRGKIGTPIVITFKRENIDEPLTKTIIRDNIKIPIIKTELLSEGVFVISLYSFSATSPNEFRNALREFVESGSDKLILDLRNNPGGYLEAALDIASWFLPTGKVVVSENFGEKGKEPKIYRSKGYDIFTDKLKFAILVNEGSASASEILAGALREYNKATLIGNKTFGKGSVQELVSVENDTSLKITVAHWLTPLGNSISENGLIPDIEVEITEENTKDGRDPVLEKAVEYLSSH